MPALIVQLSDSHLFADVGGCLKGTSTYDSLRSVLNDAMARYPFASAFLFTGDLSQDGTAESYRNLKGLLSELGEIPCYVIPGNHDQVNNIREHLLTPAILFESCVDLGNWRLLFLNTQVENEEHGFIDQKEMEALKNNVAERGCSYLICLHHPPIRLNGFIDRSRLQNSNEFFTALTGVEGRKVVLFGHAHQEYLEQRGDLVLMGAPSTCVQFKPHTPEYVKDDLPPGYRVLTLRDDGTVDTEVVRL